MIAYRLENFPIDRSIGILKNREYNLMSFFCIRCGMFHTIQRKDVVFINFGDENCLVCYNSIKDYIDKYSSYTT